MPPTSFKAPTLEEISKLLPAFDFTELFASDETSAVYFAKQRSLDRLVAIKLQLIDTDPERQSSTDSLMKSVAGLKHPNLVGVYDSGRIEGLSYYVLEFVPGKSLARSTSGVAVDISQALSIIKGISEGISYSHKQGVVHGNLNPANILLNQKVEPKIMNFGSLKKKIDQGMLRFVAPEMDSKSPATEKSDVYSIAAIFYELITGRKYDKAAASASSLCGCKKSVDEVLNKALTEDTASRTATAAEFIEHLERAVNGTSKVAIAASSTDKPGKPAAAVSSTPSPQGKFGQFRGASGSNLALKIVVIVILLIAIQLTWKYLNTAKKERAEENKRIEESNAEEAESRQKELAKIELEKEKNRPKVTRPTNPSRPTQQETAEESLERLQSALLLGRRNEMPVASKQIGGSYYLFINTRRSWNEAAAYAEQYGGHLVTDISVLGQLSREVTDGKDFWIGAGWSGSSWVLADGAMMTIPPNGKGSHAMAKIGGELVAANPLEDACFVIQWRGDGSNPGSLKAQLERTKKMLGSSPSSFPVGTVLAGDRRLLVIPGEMNWKEASDMAKSAGGELMVVSNDEENEVLKKLVTSLRKGQTVWMGGYVDGLVWKWVTGEPWRPVKWSDKDNAMDENAALVLSADAKWAAKGVKEKESGLIIEWSKDKEKNSNSNDQGEEAVKATEELVTKAKDLLEAASKKRSEAHDANDTKLKRDVDVFVKGLNKSGQERWQPVSDDLKRCVGKERVVVDELRSRDIVIANEMVKYVDYHGRKQTEINETYLSGVEKIREVFVSRITDMLELKKKNGQVKIAEHLEEILSEAEDTERWVSSLDLELAKAPEQDDEEDEDDE